MAAELPPPGCLARTADRGLIWQPSGAPGDDWYTRLPSGNTMTSPWREIARGSYGDVDLLVPVRYERDQSERPGAQQLAEAVLNPVTAVMSALVRDAGAAVTAVLLDAEARGYARGLADDRTGTP